MSLTDLTFDARSFWSSHNASLRLQISTDATAHIYTPYIDFISTWEKLITFSFFTKAEPAFELLTVGTIKEMTVRTFADIESIDSIFLVVRTHEILAQVFLNIEHYDDALMDALLEREISILDQFPDVDLDFQYIPLLGRDSEQFVPATAIRAL